jgi:hypothetical protein
MQTITIIAASLACVALPLNIGLYVYVKQGREKTENAESGIGTGAYVQPTNRTGTGPVRNRVRAGTTPAVDDDADEYVPSYGSAAPAGPKFRQCPIMTNNEMEFFDRLERACPEYRIFPQVSMAALIEPASRERYWLYFNKVAMLRCDYAVYTRDLKLLCVIELDDKTHDRKQKQDDKRDSRLSEAGINTLRFDSRRKPNVAALRAAIRRFEHTRHATEAA